MGFRFTRRFRVAPGISINLSKSGASVSVGARGAKVTVGPRGVRKTVGIPGTGLYYTTMSSWKKGSGLKESGSRSIATREEIIKKKLSPGFFRRFFLSQSEENFIDGLRAYLESNEDKALICFCQSLNIADSAFMAGLISLSGNNPQQAVVAFRQAKEQKNSLGSLFKKLGVCMSLHLPLSEEVNVEIWPDEKGVSLALVEALQQVEEYDEAVVILRELMAESPHDVSLRLSLAELLIEISKNIPDEAVALKEVIEISEGINNETALHSALLLYRGKALRKLGYFSAARDVLTAALRRKKDRPTDLLSTIRYERACVYEELGQKKRAKDEIEIATAEKGALV